MLMTVNSYMAFLAQIYYLQRLVVIIMMSFELCARLAVLAFGRTAKNAFLLCVMHSHAGETRQGATLSIGVDFASMLYAKAMDRHRAAVAVWLNAPDTFRCAWIEQWIAVSAQAMVVRRAVADCLYWLCATRHHTCHALSEDIAPFMYIDAVAVFRKKICRAPFLFSQIVRSAISSAHRELRTRDDDALGWDRLARLAPACSTECGIAPWFFAPAPRTD